MAILRGSPWEHQRISQKRDDSKYCDWKTSPFIRVIYEWVCNVLQSRLNLFVECSVERTYYFNSAFFNALLRWLWVPLGRQGGGSHTLQAAPAHYRLLLHALVRSHAHAQDHALRRGGPLSRQSFPCAFIECTREQSEGNPLT